MVQQLWRDTGARVPLKLQEITLDWCETRSKGRESSLELPELVFPLPPPTPPGQIISVEDGFTPGLAEATGQVGGLLGAETAQLRKSKLK